MSGTSTSAATRFARNGERDRKGRVLSADDIAHYRKIVVALAETIRLMADIDTLINSHGGWPAPFATRENPAAGS